MRQTKSPPTDSNCSARIYIAIVYIDNMHETCLQIKKIIQPSDPTDIPWKSSTQAFWIKKLISETGWYASDLQYDSSPPNPIT